MLQHSGVVGGKQKPRTCESWKTQELDTPWPKSPTSKVEKRRIRSLRDLKAANPALFTSRGRSLGGFRIFVANRREFRNSPQGI